MLKGSVWTYNTVPKEQPIIYNIMHLERIYGSIVSSLDWSAVWEKAREGAYIFFLHINLFSLLLDVNASANKHKWEDLKKKRRH